MSSPPSLDTLWRTQELWTAWKGQAASCTSTVLAWMSCEPSSTVFAWRQRGCLPPTLGKHLHFWAAPVGCRSRALLHVGNQESFKATFAFAFLTGNAMLWPQISLQSFCLCDLPRYLTQAAYPSFSLSLQQGCQCACVKKGCAGFFLLQAKVQTKATFSLVGMKRFPCFPLQQCYLSKACYLACLSSREWSSEGQNVYVIPQVS